MYYSKYRSGPTKKCHYIWNKYKYWVYVRTCGVLTGGGGPVLQHCPQAEVLQVGGEAGGQPGGNRGGEAQQPRREDQGEGGAAGGGRGDQASWGTVKIDIYCDSFDSMFFCKMFGHFVNCLIARFPW